MFGLTPFKKNQEIDKIGRDLFDYDGLFEDFFKDSMFPTFYKNSKQILVDIKEDDKTYTVEADLPDVKKEEINIDIKDDMLTISVERKEEKEEKKDEKEEKYIRRERKVCSMKRSFYLENVNKEDVTAKFENGVLTIVLPKKEVVKNAGTKIEIG